MGSKNDFHEPACTDQTVTPSTTPGLLTALLTTDFINGVNYIELHNISESPIYFYYVKTGDSIPGATDADKRANMRKIPADTIVQLNWHHRKLAGIYVASDTGTDKIVVSLCGQPMGW